MNTTEYTDYNEAVEALEAATALETHKTAIKTYQHPVDLKWVWEVATTPLAVNA